MCVCNGVAMTENQNYIAKVLYKQKVKNVNDASHLLCKNCHNVLKMIYFIKS